MDLYGCGSVDSMDGVKGLGLKASAVGGVARAMSGPVESQYHGFNDAVIAGFAHGVMSSGGSVLVWSAHVVSDIV